MQPLQGGRRPLGIWLPSVPEAAGTPSHGTFPAEAAGPEIMDLCAEQGPRPPEAKGLNDLFTVI